MATSLYLAQVIGWYLVIMGALMFLKFDAIKSVMREIIAKRELIFIIAFMTLILGLLMVCAHNRWLWGWPVIITLLSWLTLIAGIFRLFFPKLVVSMGTKMLNAKLYIKTSSIVMMILGIYLLFEAYSAYF